MIGLDESDEHVFNLCVTNNHPLGDLHGDQIFTLAGMELTQDCDIVWTIRPIQIFETIQASQNATLSTIGAGWNVKTHINWFDKMIDITKFQGKLGWVAK